MRRRVRPGIRRQERFGGTRLREGGRHTLLIGAIGQLHPGKLLRRSASRVLRVGAISAIKVETVWEGANSRRTRPFCLRYAPNLVEGNSTKFASTEFCEVRM